MERNESILPALVSLSFLGAACAFSVAVEGISEDAVHAANPYASCGTNLEVEASVDFFRAAPIEQQRMICEANLGEARAAYNQAFEACLAAEFSLNGDDSQQQSDADLNCRDVLADTPVARGFEDAKHALAMVNG